MRASLLALVAVLLCSTAQAVTMEQPMADPQQEQQARAIFRELRCMVCEGQSLAESDAVLAVQMRAQVRDRLKQGESPRQIIDYFRQSYGEHILMTPPFETRTWLLWIMPILLLLFGGIAIWRSTRGQEEGA